MPTRIPASERTSRAETDSCSFKPGPKISEIRADSPRVFSTTCAFVTTMFDRTRKPEPVPALFLTRATEGLHLAKICSEESGPSMTAGFPLPAPVPAANLFVSAEGLPIQATKGIQHAKSATSSTPTAPIPPIM